MRAVCGHAAETGANRVETIVAVRGQKSDQQKILYDAVMGNQVKGRGAAMSETHYLISDASKKVDVESHVLRYWEEELEMNIPRNECHHEAWSIFRGK